MEPEISPGNHFARELEIQSCMQDYCKLAISKNKPETLARALKPKAKKLQEQILHVFVEHLLRVACELPIFTHSFHDKMVNLISTNNEAKQLLKLHKKIIFTVKQGVTIQIESAEAPTFSLLSAKMKTLKYQAIADRLQALPKILSTGKKEEILEVYKNLPGKVRKIIKNILHFVNCDPDSSEYKNVMNMFAVLQTIKDANGKDIFLQISELFIEKKRLYADLVILNSCLADSNPLARETLLNQLTDQSLKAALASSKKDLLAIRQVIELAKDKIAQIDDLFRMIIQRIDADLSIYETSTDRLAEKFGKDILHKPVTVTMVGVEYAGLVKEGGLAEALEGLSQGLLKQHPENKVRLIFPKFSLLPKAILESLKTAPRTEYKDLHNNPFTVFTLDLNGVEGLFIEHPHFQITSEKQSIYAGSEQEMKERLVTFSGLAADLLLQLPKSDIIHLHDWHVAGVELKLKNQNRTIAPIVFTYHNNQRAAQGRLFHNQYNYEPVMQGLRQAGIGSTNVNLMVDAIKNADAVTTVSNSFAYESQSTDRGEGVSFAIREAARDGKLRGIVNGTNVDRWDPQTDATLARWKDTQTQQEVDLRYGPESGDLLEKKLACKQQLQKWIASEFPDIKFDCAKPLVTYIGRFDSYQKGLDKFEEAIIATLKNGGQFICMGSLEDPKATAILDDLQKRYKDGVLFIRDFKQADGKLRYQQGTATKQGVGSLIRAATNFVFAPSYFEPCGLVQFEAWLFGSLVIGSNVGGLADTIIPPDKAHFNGYLFDREKKQGHSLSLTDVIGTALQEVKDESPDMCEKRIARIMKEGKSYSWNAAQFGLSPVEKYRLVYQSAAEFAKTSQKGMIQRTFDFHNLRRIIHSFSAEKREQLPTEESYLKAYYNGATTQISTLYHKLPEWVKQQLPAPYRLTVNFLEFETLGAHYSERATTFRVHAPHANEVLLLLYNDQNKPLAPIEMGNNGSGKWSVAIEGVALNSRYQFIIDGKTKIDPYGIATEPVSQAEKVPCSIVANRTFTWNDQAWMQQREKLGDKQPISIYEMHLTSWMTKEGAYLNYRELAPKLVAYCKMTGYTHVELMGLLEHPYEGSHGYQVTNYFSPNSRLGSVEDFKYFVDYLHQSSIGIILDWVPAHFAVDDYALTSFDGTNQFEASKISMLFSMRFIFMSRWGTHAFSYKKQHVRDFLISSAIYWLKEMHIDGLRVDAVEMILRSEDAKTAHNFLRSFNDIVHTQFPGALTFAEDYSGALQITEVTSRNGYGFDYKWNVNWTNHIFNYLHVTPEERPMHYNRLIQAIDGDASHKMVYAISHDEIGRKPLITHTPGLTEGQKYANVRLLFALQMSLPGKKLSFMGSQTGSPFEWAQLVGARQGGLLDPELTQAQQQLQTTVTELNALYKATPGLLEGDSNAKDLEWIEKDAPDDSFVAFRRKSGKNEKFAYFHNFSVNKPKTYRVVLQPEALQINVLTELFNSNEERFGGDGTCKNTKIALAIDTNKTVSYTVHVAPLSSVVICESTLEIATKL